MKTSITKHIPLLLIAILVGLSFTTDRHRSRYKIPLAAYSVTAGDIDVDGDNDIIVGHNYNFQINWSGITMMNNDGLGVFAQDSFFLNGNHSNVELGYINSNAFPDLITQVWNDTNTQIGIVFDLACNESYTTAIDINDYAQDIVVGDINNDNLNDIIFASHKGHFWAVLYNEGDGIFSVPEYHYVYTYFPLAIACDDLNQDGRDDIVICGQKTEVYFSYPNGFVSLLLETGGCKEEVAIVDFDLDGKKDILSFMGIMMPGTPGITTLLMYKNLGNNTFDTIPEFYFLPMSNEYFVADFNNDTLQDILFLLSNQTGCIIYHNQGDFQLGDSLFVPINTYEYEGPRNCFCGDMDGNRYNDIVITRLAQIPLPDNLVILFNNGKGHFEEEPMLSVEDPITDNHQVVLSCYPNPFSSHTTFSITPQDNNTPIAISIYNLQGQLIQSLTPQNRKGADTYTLTWQGQDHSGNTCAPGTYIAVLSVNGKTQQLVKLIKSK